MAEIGIRKTVKGDYEKVLAKLPEVLKAEGFGVLTRIDVKATLKEKIGVEFRLDLATPFLAVPAGIVTQKPLLDLGVALRVSL